MLYLLMQGTPWYICLLSLIVLIFSMTIHEIAHGLVALWCGDRTAKLSGRLTLDPRAHLTRAGLMAMLLLPIGWANPVPINPYNFKNKRLGTFLVSIAGCASNLLLAFIACLFIAILGMSGMSNISATSLGLILYCFGFVNVGLAIFNLIPLPPLDGSKILYLFIPLKWQMKIAQIERYGMIPIFLLVYVFSDYLSIAIMGTFSMLLKLAFLLFGIPV